VCSYEEEDTCVSYEEEEEEDTCVSYEEDDTCVHMRRRIHVCHMRRRRRRIHVCHMRRMTRVFI